MLAFFNGSPGGLLLLKMKLLSRETGKLHADLMADVCVWNRLFTGF